MYVHIFILFFVDPNRSKFNSKFNFYPFLRTTLATIKKKGYKCDNSSYKCIFKTWRVTELWNTKPFSLIKLPFNPENMRPFLSTEAIEYHYAKHHAAYVKNLNNLAEENCELKKMTLEEIIVLYNGVIHNNAAQLYNHNFFWLGIKEDGGGEPYGVIKEKIEENFTDFQNFKDQFTKEALSHFGSGWIWLIIKKNKLKIHQGHDDQTPLKGAIGHPILTLDIWEHAYYVDYRNARIDYIKEWFNKINWDFANYNLFASLEGQC
uniref:Superoxide dismutase [Mn], mitochondrial n=1 Tax=Piliocolobus tephrosceles TaxID=591936 RepID=A0A8C9GBG6_9PRIM